MEDLLVEKTEKIDAELYDEEGYSIASLEEGIADYKAGRTRSFKSWDDMMKTLQWEIDNDI